MGVIVVGVDGSANARAALAWAMSEAARRGSIVRAVGVWSYPTVGLMEGVVPALPGNEQPAEVLEHLMAAVAEVPPEEGVEIQTALETGSAGPVLVAQSEESDVEMLVVGARKSWLGSAATYVAHHAQCPVVIVPSRG